MDIKLYNKLNLFKTILIDLAVYNHFLFTKTYFEASSSVASCKVR
jgi:hypothetical protein